ncbi:MAG: transcriptional regulator [Breznakia sp.]
MQRGLNLSVTDRIILNSYRSVVDGLANYLGIGYEVVLHSLEDYEKSVVKLMNAQPSGRKTGIAFHESALSILERIEEANAGGYLSYETKNKKGRAMRSSSMIIYGERKRAIGLVCIHFYLDTPLLKSFPFFTLNGNGINVDSPLFNSNDVNAFIHQAYDKALCKVIDDDTIATTLKNKMIIQNLYEQGIFDMKDAVIKVSEIMNLSKNTVYMHLRTIKKQSH